MASVRMEEYTTVRVVAKAVLGDLLRVQYAVASDVQGNMAFVTPGRIA